MKPEPKIEGPYFIVVKGTNQRWTIGKDQKPRIYDTEEIAQMTIDASQESRKDMKMELPMEDVPISVVEYNEKYAKLMGIKED